MSEYLAKPYTPQEIDPALRAFPAQVRHLMPPQSDIPDEFKGHGNNTWLAFQSDWMFNGLDPATEIVGQDGVSPERAFYHLSAIQRSFEPKHEHKMSAVAYLASLWFVRVTNGDKMYGEKD